MPHRTTESGQRKTLSREDWIEAARKVLEKRGIAAVKIDALARQLKVTRGSFYFHFKGLSDLHEGLAELWRQRNVAPFLLLEKLEVAGRAFFEKVVRVWVDEKTFSPSLDMAVRDWSRTSKQLTAEMAETDALRINLLKRAFVDMGYPDDESTVRARITYLHQIGYYAVGFDEPVADRRHFQPIYGRVLEGPLAE
ncbi:MAG: TetR/AcrR family transcriptional regulator [Devosia sp.]